MCVRADFPFAIAAQLYIPMHIYRRSLEPGPIARASSQVAACEGDAVQARASLLSRRNLQPLLGQPDHIRRQFSVALSLRLPQRKCTGRISAMR